MRTATDLRVDDGRERDTGLPLSRDLAVWEIAIQVFGPVVGKRTLVFDQRCRTLGSGIRR